MVQCAEQKKQRERVVVQCAEQKKQREMIVVQCAEQKRQRENSVVQTKEPQIKWKKGEEPGTTAQNQRRTAEQVEKGRNNCSESEKNSRTM